jgi:hypothetical protein
MSFTNPLTILEDETVTIFVLVSISNTAKLYNTISITLIDAEVVNGIISKSTLGETLTKSYIGSVPENIIIDGAFADWENIEKITDTRGDSGTLSTDLSEYSITNDTESIYFYFDVLGEMMKGAHVPEDPTFYSLGYIQQPDTDGDGVHDSIDPNPRTSWDSDGDGLADDYENIISKTNSTQPDTDLDGWMDGEDLAPLDPEIPNNLPPELAKPLLAGADTAHIFIDTDKNMYTGYRVFTPGAYIGAEYLIEITGKYGYIISSELLSYAGTGFDWEWDFLGNAPVGKDLSQLETKLDFNDIGTLSDEGYDVLFHISDWSKNNEDWFDSIFSHTSSPIVERTSKNTVQEEEYLLTELGTRAGGTRSGLTELVNGTGGDGSDRFGWNVSYAGDVNGDGYSDIIIGAPYSNLTGLNDIIAGNVYDDSITILNGTSDNVWEAPGTLGPSDFPGAIFVGDANNDGYNDIITADDHDNVLSVYNGTGDGDWDPRHELSVGTNPTSVFVGDANNDGLNDIISSDFSDNTVSIFNGTSSGGWEARGTLNVGTWPYVVFVADANNDGYNDIVTCDFTDDIVSIYNGTSSNVWEARSTLNVGNGPKSVYVSDANNDGYNDTLTVDMNDGKISIYNGTSDNVWEADLTML